LPTILVADDNSNIQKMVTLAFKGEGIDVVAVGNGEAAVKKAIEIVPDLVLADIFMPVRSGYEVCEFLKQDSRFSHIPVVLLAGAFDPFDEREAQRVGADGVLKKPFVPPDPLVTLVKGLLAKNLEKLVTVAVPTQTTAVSAQGSSATPESSASSAPAFTPPAFVPPPFPSAPAEPSVKEDEYPEDEMDMATTAPPMRDFSIPVTPAETEHHGGADAFGSMLDTSPLDAVMPPMRKLGEPVTEEEVGEDREIQPASAHTAFEGFSPWRASASSAGVVEEEETADHAAEQPNQFMPSPKDLMGRVWEVDTTLADKSPDETVIEPRDAMSPLTHSAQHITTVRESGDAQVAIPAEPEPAAIDEPEPIESQRVSDWRSAFAKAPEETAKVVESAAPSLSPWSLPTTPAAETVQNDAVAEVSSASEISSVEENSSVGEVSSDSAVEAHAEPVPEFVSVADLEPIVETPSVDAPTSSDAYDSDIHGSHAVEAEPSIESTSHADEVVEPEHAHVESASAAAMEVAEPVVAEEHVHHEYAGDTADQDRADQSAEAEHHAENVEGAAPAEEIAPPVVDVQSENNDWIAALPAHLSTEDTVTIARSVVEQLAPSAVESVATSFPVPTAAPSDPRVVEDIVARVVERMQPQILEMITREVLRPVVEALVRRQLEQKLPE
jgi:CheY-like chemotaxis protein